MQDTLHHAEAAPATLRDSAANGGQLRTHLFSNTESAENWLKFEQLFYSCLAIGDDQEALACLDLLQNRFGGDNDRVQSLRGIYEECQGSGRQSEEVISRYDNILKDNPVNMPIAKRKIALLLSVDRESEAITALCKLLDLSQTDVEAWAELADLYQRRALYRQAIFCLEEVLLVQPNAWNIHARIGELSMKQASTMANDQLAAHESLVTALQHFCRSIELCGDYVRGYAGLKKCAASLLAVRDRTTMKNPENFSWNRVAKLHDLAISKLQIVVERYPKDGAMPPEILAASAILGS